MASWKKIVKATGSLSFEIELSDGKVIRWHQDHIHKCLVSVGTLDANSSHGITDHDTLNIDSTDAPNTNTPEATVANCYKKKSSL